MSCDCTEKVSLLIDGELPEHEAREAQRHLLQCADCQQAQADFLSFRNQIGAYVPQLQPISQREALDRILSRQPQKGRAIRAARPAWSWSFSPRLAAFATVLLLALIIGVAVYRNLNREDRNPIQAQLQKQESDKQPTVKNKPNKQQDPGSTSEPAPSPKPKTTPSPDANPKVPLPKRRLPPPDPSIFANDRSRPAQTVAPVAAVRSGDTQTLTAMHLEKSELLLRAFRNVQMDKPGANAEVAYEKKQARQLVLQNMMLRLEADTAGDVQVAALLENLEPILLDIANLPRKPTGEEIEVIKQRVERKNIVALLQVNSTALARALDD